MSFMVNHGLIDCVLYQVTAAKVVEQEITKAMAKANISFDDRIKLDLGLSKVPEIIFLNGLYLSVCDSTHQRNSHLLLSELRAVLPRGSEVFKQTFEAFCESTSEPPISFLEM